MASLTPVTVANLAITGTLSAAGMASTGLLTAAGLNNTGNLATTGTSALTGLATASAGINVIGSKTLNFGSDQTKATNAGNIGYQIATSGALDVYGAGTAVGSRNLQLWDNITVPGTSTLTGRVNANGGVVVTGGLTVDGKAVTGGTGGTTTTTKKVPWTNVPMASGTQGGNLQYSVDGLGIGRLRGSYNSGSLGYTVQATIPAAGRPGQFGYYLASNYSFYIDSSGNIGQGGGPTPSTFYFDGISYDTSAT